MRLTRNAIRCHECDEVVASMYRHDFRGCFGGHVTVDGGLAYARRIWVEGATWDELCEYEEDET